MEKFISLSSTDGGHDQKRESGRALEDAMVRKEDSDDNSLQFQKALQPCQLAVSVLGSLSLGTNIFRNSISFMLFLKSITYNLGNACP